MKLTYYLLLIAALLLTACNNDEDEENEFIMTTPPIGETFEGSETSITFESEDSVSIHILYPEERMKHPVGKSKYLFDNGKIQILSPHEPSFPSIEATETFVRSFEGRFTSNNRLEARFTIISEHAYCSMMGTGLWYRVKHPQ